MNLTRRFFEQRRLREEEEWEDQRGDEFEWRNAASDLRGALKAKGMKVWNLVDFGNEDDDNYRFVAVVSEIRGNNEIEREIRGTFYPDTKEAKITSSKSYEGA